MAEIKAGTNEFYIEDNGEVIAKIEYTPSGTDANGNELITVTHTNVNESHSGKGLGKQLVNKVAEYAEAENKRIIPECSYAKKILERDEQYHNVLAK